jgi:predicted phage terminase large subunit-like protein
MALVKQTLDEWLDDVDYKKLDNYVPSEFALMFMTFIKLVNGGEGEAHKTPPVHLAMLDKVETGGENIANLCFRGAAKTTLFMEYLCLFIAVFGYLPGLGEVSGMIYVSDSMDNGVKSARKNIEFRYFASDFLQEWLPKTKFTDNYLEFENKEGHRLGVKMFGAKTGIRGTKIFGKRPTLAILDDLVSDEDAKSKASMALIKDTVYKGINFALDPTKRKTVFNGTPFNMEDILIEAVESGAWDVNVWPVCEKFPCSREEFRGAWDDRFSYDFVLKQYEDAVLNGKLEAFNQELMLRISSEEARLVSEGDLRWYKRQELLALRQNFNFYITTDFATSSKQTADYSVISVWAYGPGRDWFWVDGIAAKQSMDKTQDDLFRLVQEYQPLSVGIEVTGQQGGFIPLFQREQMHRNIWFNFATSGNSNLPGMRPQTDKLSRFQLVVPFFKAGKIHFPSELRSDPIMNLATGQIRLATINGLKGKDDFIDTISMLAQMPAVLPSGNGGFKEGSHDQMWDDTPEAEFHSLSSYVV